MQTPYKIGLTGGIGSGKTTICKIFESLGIPIFNSDEYAKQLLKNNTQIIEKIKKTFGKNIVNKNRINKKKISQIIFSNKKKLKIINDIIHPVVIEGFNQWCEKQTTKYIIKESALLFESKTYRELDKIIWVEASENLRIKRVEKRDNRTKSEIKKIINNQIHYKDVKTKIDYLINNNETILITPLILKIHEEMGQL